MSIIKKLPLGIFTLLLVACSSTGSGFNAAGLDSMTYGVTTLDQASEYLGSKPENIWQQGDSTLSRWAYKGTLVTDAIYMRKELWLRFGADGALQNIEQTINIPGIYSPKRRAENPAQKDSQRTEKSWQQQWEDQKDGNWIEIPAGDSTGIEVQTISN